MPSSSRPNLQGSRAFEFSEAEMPKSDRARLLKKVCGPFLD